MRRACATAVAGFVLASWTARAEEVAPAAPAPDPASTPAPLVVPAEEVSKTECLARHEYAQVARRQRRLLDARTELLLCSRASCPGPIRADCIDWLAEVGRSLPSVVVTARARGADVVDVKVTVDGKLMSEKLSGAALDLDPGEHRFRFESPPWPVVERTILVSEGIKDRPIDVELAPPDPVASPASPPRPPFRLQQFDYVLGAVAVAGLGAFGYFAGSGLYERKDLLEHCAPFCKPHEVEGVRTRLIAADVSLGVVLAALVVDVYLHATRPVEAEARGAHAKVTAGAVASGALVGVRGAF